MANGIDHSSAVCHSVAAGNGLLSLTLPMEHAADLLLRLVVAVLTAVLSNLVYRVVDRWLKQRGK